MSTTLAISLTSVSATAAPTPSSTNTTPLVTDAASEEPAEAQPPPPLRPRRGVHLSHHLDLDVDGGVAWDFEGERITGFGRLRIGILSVVEQLDRPTESPMLFSLGATYGLSSFSPAEVGVELEVTHIKSGVWAQAGAAIDLSHPGPVARLGLGWSIVGIEAQRRLLSPDDATEASAGFLIGAKLRVPVGVLLFALMGK